MSFIAGGLGTAGAMTAMGVGAGALGAGAGYLGAKASNKRRPGGPDLPMYSGLRTPRVDTPEYQSFRPVQKQATEIALRRSAGQDTGFDPARLEALKGNFNINQQQAKERDVPDIMNQLSGTGMSRNLAARDILLGRYQQDAEREKNKYFNQYDIEDLSAKREDKNLYSQMLANLNQQNFGQENKAADFDLSVYGAENAARTGNYQGDVMRFNQYQDPMGTAMETGFSSAGAVGGMRQQGAMTNYINSLAKGQGQASKAGTFGNSGALTTGNYYPGVSSMSGSLRRRSGGF